MFAKLFGKGIEADDGVPDLGAPRSALLEVVEFKTDTRRAHSHMRARVLPVGGEARDVEVVSRATPSRFSGMVPGSRYPALVDDAADAVLVVEPTCGYKAPGESAFAAMYGPRDARTAELRTRYPAPTVADIEQVVRSGGGAADPAVTALRIRMSLLTTLEAAAILDLVVGSPGWSSAVRRLDIARELDLTAAEGAAEAVSHLDSIAGRPDLDIGPLLSIDAAVGNRELTHAAATRDDLDEPFTPTDLRVIVEPFERVTGRVLA